MSEFLRRSKPAVPFAVPILLVLALRILFPANICDDAYISFKVAGNLADGKGLVFNPGQRIYISTTLPWCLLLAGGRMLLPDMVLVARILGTISEMLLMGALVYLGHRAFGSRAVGMLGAVFLCANPVFLLTSFSGMELPLYLALVVFSLALLAGKRYTWSLLVAALAACTRLDGLVAYGVVAAWTCWERRKAPPGRVAGSFVPSLAVLAALLVFGYLYYGSAVPMSVSVKSRYSQGLLTPRWIKGARGLAAVFMDVFWGRYRGWHPGKALLLALTLPTAVGLVRLVVAKRWRLIPLAAFPFVYAAAYVGTGAAYARNFPWYFVPPLPALYPFAAWGVAWIVSAAGRLRSTGSAAALRCAAAVLIAAWAAVLIVQMKTDARNLTARHGGREELYAASSIWLGRMLPAGSTIAANEIGAIGFFARPDIEIIDMFGLLKKPGQPGDFVEFVRTEQPEAILTDARFRYRARLGEKLPDDYVWSRFRTLSIGIRSDLAPGIGLEGLDAMYEGRHSEREYRWN